MKFKDKNAVKFPKKYSIEDQNVCFKLQYWYCMIPYHQQGGHF